MIYKRIEIGPPEQPRVDEGHESAGGGGSIGMGGGMIAPLLKRQKQCGKKLRYDSETDARSGMVEHHGRRPDFNVYLCPHCEFWHVGHVREDAA